jgi:hypothetical protein
MNPSDEARDYVSAALSIISNQVRVERGLTSIRGAGSEGRDGGCPQSQEGARLAADECHHPLRLRIIIASGNEGTGRSC